MVQKVIVMQILIASETYCVMNEVDLTQFQVAMGRMTVEETSVHRSCCRKVSRHVQSNNHVGTDQMLQKENT